MQFEPSMLSLAACILYLLVAIATGFAAREARRTRQASGYFGAWSLISILFVLLIISRLLGLEEMLREFLRGVLEAQGLASDRRSIQGPLIAAAIVIFSAALMLAVYWTAQRIKGRRTIALAVALSACGVMLATIAMRTISLHALDRLLNGPLKLNWVGDIGASIAVLMAAIVYARIVSGKAILRR